MPMHYQWPQMYQMVDDLDENIQPDLEDDVDDENDEDDDYIV